MSFCGAAVSRAPDTIMEAAATRDISLVKDGIPFPPWKNVIQNIALNDMIISQNFV